MEGSVIINKVRESEPGVGFDAYKEEYVDMVSEGILDPAKVTRSALQNANSVASTLLTTESVVSGNDVMTRGFPDICFDTDIRGSFFIFGISAVIDKRIIEKLRNYVKIMNETSSISIA